MSESLFELTVDPTLNLLPYDGTVLDFGIILSSAVSEAVFNALLTTVEWKNDEVTIIGQRIITRRKFAFLG